MGLRPLLFPKTHPVFPELFEYEIPMPWRIHNDSKIEFIRNHPLCDLS
jgi:hypothetical protein